MARDSVKNENMVAWLHYGFKCISPIVGGLAIYLGYRLFILGVTGQAKLTVDVHTIKGQLVNAAPGLFFAVGGIVIVIVAAWKGIRERG